MSVVHEENLLGLHTIQEQTFLGVRLTQSWADLKLWEIILNDHPELTTIIEIGTWEGGMSRYLQTQATERGMGFTTMDITRPPKETPGFVPIDVFEEADEVRAWLAHHSPLILLCDGGDKPREINEFGSSLQPEDILVVHDWLGEVGPNDVPPCLEGVYENVCDSMKSHSRVFVRKGTAD